MSRINPRLEAFQKWVKSNDLSTKRVAKAAGIAYTTLASFVQQDTYTLKGDTEQKIADAFNCSTEDIFVTGRKTTPRNNELSIEGKVSAGNGGYFDSHYPPGHGGTTIRFDPAEISLVVEIDGDSMQPRYRDGDKVMCGYRYDDPTPVIRQDVMAQTRDGRKLFKTLRQGSKPGLWDLYSINPAYDPIRDVELDWVVPVKFIAV